MEEQLCPICHENNDNQKYTLPECNHTFCTECIMHWFRQGHTRCPMCRNPGHVDQDNANLDFFTTSYYGLNQKVNFLKKYSRRRDADQLLKKYVKDLREAEKKEREISKELVNFKKNYVGTYNELMKKTSSFRNKKGRLHKKTWDIKKQICAFPIETVTIVNRVTLFDDNDQTSE